MEMLLRSLTFVELAQLLERHNACSPAPHLLDSEAKKRARQTAQSNGLWEQIARDLDSTRDISVIKRSVFRNFQRNGNRVPHQECEQARARELELAALALWLDHPKADVDYLQDIIWAYCDDWTWIMAAHEYATVDLGSAMRGARLAEIIHALQDRIEAEVAERLHAEIERRIFRKVADYENTEFWHTARMNWNHVCNGGVIRAALLEMKDSRVLARFIHPRIQNMTYALDGFTEDGGCKEGASYWGFGFGHFVQAAYALHCRSGGELNIMAEEKIERICRFPLASHIAGDQRAGFGDCGKGSLRPLNALLINHFYDIPELYELCPRQNSEDAAVGAGPLKIDDMHSLALYRGEKATGIPDQRDYVLPDLGLAKMRGRAGKNQMTVVAVAGNNGVPHSHNDVGSFQVYRRGRMVLTDPGAPLYNKQTFSDRRYEILWCRSRGHSLPIINGEEQRAGSEHRGELSVEGFNEAEIKKTVVDMTRAYPQGTVDHLVRSLELDATANILCIEDVFRFQQTPQTVEEAFVTFEEASVSSDGCSVKIGADDDAATLAAEQAGSFEVKTLTGNPEHTRPGTPPLKRIQFSPATLAPSLVLRFSVR